MGRRTTLAIVSVVLLVLSAVAPSVVAAEEPLDVEVNQGRLGEAAVTVTANGTAVGNATVTVSTANASYAGNGTYETDADGSVDLPAPEESVTVDVTATEGNRTASVTQTLVAPSLDVSVAQAEDGSATATVTFTITGDAVENADATVSTVDENASYAGTGSYESDANGTVALPAPEETVDVSIEASAANLSGETTATLQNQSAILEEDSENFGQTVSRFVHLLRGDDVDVPWMGRMVADFVTANNPGNAPDHAGPKDDTGPDDGEDDAAPDADGDESSDGDDPSAEDDDRGPPAHAGGDDRGGAGGGNGPPAHASGNGNGNGR